MEKTTFLKTVIAVPYSANPDIINIYRDKFKNTNIIVPNSIEAIQEHIITEYEKLSKDAPIIIIEVGGYAASILKTLISINSNLIGIVEDTNQGHWNYEKIIHDFNIPVYSIAQSKIKSLENRLIGKAVVFSLEDILRKDFYKTFCGLRITVLGYGKIGKSVVRSLKSRDAIISVWDINSIHRFQARLDGYNCPRTKEEALLNSDVVLGVSGKNSFLLDDIAHLKNDAILVSGSSKDVEFKHDELITISHQSDKGESSSRLVFNDKSFTILNAGRPVNFLHNSVLSSVLEMIFSELYLCVYSIVENNEKKGINKVDSHFHTYLCDKWEELYLN